MLLVIVVVVALVTYILSMYAKDDQHAKKIRDDGLFIGIYVLLFAYPVVVVKVVGLFLCSFEVEGMFYLHSDLSIQCFTSEWYAYAAYAWCWVACYVIAFPAFVLWKLFTYRHTPNDSNHALGFLMQDFKPLMPMVLWEGVEMIRKALLSVLGVFWTHMSSTCIATALLISVVFLVAHFHFNPYKSVSLARMQGLSLTVLALFYFLGLLLQTDASGQLDRKGFGLLLLLLLVSIFVAAIVVVISELNAVTRWTWSTWHAFSILYEGEVQEERGVPCIASFPGE
jgi:hypothetical protein